MSTPTPAPIAASTDIATKYRLKAWTAWRHDPVAHSTTSGTSRNMTNTAATVFRKVST